MAINLGSFSTPSNSKIIDVNNQKTHKFKIRSSNIIGSVVVRIEDSDDKNNWDNVTSSDCQITKDTVTNLIITEVLPVNNLRFVYVSGTGDLEVVYTNY